MTSWENINTTRLVGWSLLILVLAVSLVRLTATGTLVAALVASALAGLGWLVFDFALAPLRAEAGSAGTATTDAPAFADTDAS